MPFLLHCSNLAGNSNGIPQPESRRPQSEIVRISYATTLLQQKGAIEICYPIEIPQPEIRFFTEKAHSNGPILTATEARPQKATPLPKRSIV
jgi:hypothetical protein